jgi:hypothetical protein
MWLRLWCRGLGGSGDGLEGRGAGGGGRVCLCPEIRFSYIEGRSRGGTYEEDAGCEKDGDTCYVDCDVCRVAVVCAILLFVSIALR